MGGLRDKLLAAKEAGLARVLVPERSMRSAIADVPAALRGQLVIVPCRTAADALRAAFDPPLLPPEPEATNKEDGDTDLDGAAGTEERPRARL